MIPLCVDSQTMKVVFKSFSENSEELEATLFQQISSGRFWSEALMGLRGVENDINYGIDTIVNNMICRI